MANTITIDGSHGEGGGQIIRTSLSLAVITGQTLEMSNIRARRSKPGLQPQHLAAARAAAAICGASLSGDAVGSTMLHFSPGTPPHAESYRFDIGTAGSSPLVAQTVLLPLALMGRPASVSITGGTHVPHSPPGDCLDGVYLPALRRAGLGVEFNMPRAGFYPRGGGELLLQIAPIRALYPLDFTSRGKIRSLKACITLSQLPEHVGERGKAEVEKQMKAIGRRVQVEVRDRPSNGPGAAVTLVAECESGLAGFSAIGERGKPMEKVAADACAPFMAWWKTETGCDEHLADQLVLPLALCRGESQWTTPMITEHRRTVLWVIHQFLPVEASLEERPDGSGLVRLTGSR